jgi:beta-glucosidase/6-phospho-beta-glucosidase/beta-galactosidase
LLRAHSKAVGVYRKEFVKKQKGKIGITLNSDWGEPVHNSTEAVQAVKRFMEFNLGWFAEPIYKGDYPSVMRQTVGSRLPTFTNEEKASLLGSADFFGLNHYTTQLITGYTGTPGSSVSPGLYSFWNDEAVRKSADPSWGHTDMNWPIVPSGFRKVLNYIQREYNPPGGILVTENGIAVSEPSLQTALADTSRQTYYKDYISELHKAIVEDKVNVKGYFLWSLMDNFEWAYGYTKRFGLYYVDYATQKRTPKPAAKWYTKLITSNRIPN